MLNILHNQVTQSHFCVLFAYNKSSTLIIGRRTESNRTADGIRSDGGRNPIGRRTESDRAADGIRLDGGRDLIGRRTEHDDKTLATIKLCTHYII